MENGNNNVSKCRICGLIPPGAEPKKPDNAIDTRESYEDWVAFWEKYHDTERANISQQEWLKRKELGDKWREEFFAWKKAHDIHAICKDRFERFQFSTIPIRYRRIEQLSPTQGNQQALAAIAARKEGKKSKGLFLYGDVGVGKTHLMAIYAKHLILHEGASLIWWDTTSLFTSLKNNFDKNYKEEPNDSNEEITNRAIRADWLFLDDLGREKASDWTHEVLFNIVNSRYENSRNGIAVSSNYSPVELAKRIGDQIVSRLIEMCGEPINITGEDWRFKNMNKEP